MSKDKGPFMKFGGQVAEFCIRLTKALAKRGVTSEQIWEFVEKADEAALEQVAEAFAKAICGYGAFRVAIDRSKSLGAMIEEGRYDWTNSDITAAHFPVKGDGIRESDLFHVHLNCSVSTEEALAALDARGLRPVTIEELLAFGATFPEEQRKFPIVALGSVWQLLDGRRACAYLHGGAGGRRLHLYWLGGGWDSSCRFLAARKF